MSRHDEPGMSMKSAYDDMVAHRRRWQTALAIMNKLRHEARCGSGRNFWTSPGFNVTCVMQAGRAKWTINGGRTSGERALRAIIIRLKEQGE